MKGFLFQSGQLAAGLTPNSRSRAGEAKLHDVVLLLLKLFVLEDKMKRLIAHAPRKELYMNPQFFWLDFLGQLIELLIIIQFFLKKCQD